MSLVSKGFLLNKRLIISNDTTGDEVVECILQTGGIVHRAHSLLALREVGIDIALCPPEAHAQRIVLHEVQRGEPLSL